MKGRVTGSVSCIHEGRVLLQKTTDPRDIPDASCVVDAEQKGSALEEMADESQTHADDGTKEPTPLPKTQPVVAPARTSNQKPIRDSYGDFGKGPRRIRAVTL
jgi:hypothetical protein